MQREMTVHHCFKHEGQSIRKMSSTFKVSSSAVVKTIKRYDETGSHEDRHRNGRPRVTSNEFILCSRVNSFRVQVTNTSQHQLFRGDYINQAFMVELLKKKTTKGHQ